MSDRTKQPFCIKQGQKFCLSLTINDTVEGSFLDLTGWTAKLRIEYGQGLIYTVGDGIEITPGAVENQVNITIPTEDTIRLEVSKVEGDLDIIGADGETEFSVLMQFDVERRARYATNL